MCVCLLQAPLAGGCWSYLAIRGLCARHQPRRQGLALGVNEPRPGPASNINCFCSFDIVSLRSSLLFFSPLLVFSEHVWAWVVGGGGCASGAELWIVCYPCSSDFHLKYMHDQVSFFALLLFVDQLISGLSGGFGGNGVRRDTTFIYLAGSEDSPAG